MNFMIYFTSDTHFGHKRIIEFDQDPFSNIDERDNAILENHNSIVTEKDDVWHLGDVAFSTEKLDWYLSNAKGRIHLIRGNHDDGVAWKNRQRFSSANEALYLRAEGRKIYLSHYALRVWRNSHHGSYHLFGHSHGNLPDLNRSMDVGVKPNKYTPVSLAKIIEIFESRPVTAHHEFA